MSSKMASLIILSAIPLILFKVTVEVFPIGYLVLAFGFYYLVTDQATNRMSLYYRFLYYMRERI